MKRIFLVMLMIAGCESEQLGVYWGGHIPDEKLMVIDSTNVVIKYIHPDDGNWSACQLFQSMAYVDEPDYIIYDTATVRLVNGLEFFVVFNHKDSITIRDTIRFMPYKDSVYTFGATLQPRPQ